MQHKGITNESKYNKKENYQTQRTYDLKYFEIKKGEEIRKELIEPHKLRRTSILICTLLLNIVQKVRL